ncbi:MAG: serine/threonine protein kinase, partial [Planctomycetaceae bacterium]|nr:serine/threonine protein kinase [Planctomycetaceae bacterium]
MRRLSPLLIAVLVMFFAGVADAENWARFRGPDGKGISSQKGLPVTWTDK